MAIEIRALSGLDELRRWAAVRNAVFPDDPDDPDQIVLVRAAEPTHLNLLATIDGEPAGTALFAGDPVTVDGAEQYVEVAVLPERRGAGVGTALLQELSRRARPLGKTSLLCTARADDGPTIEFLEHRGFRSVERCEYHALDLGGALPPLDPPDGVEVTSLLARPDLLAAMYEVGTATAAERGGHVARQAESLHDWHAYELGDSALALDLTTIAVADGTVAGFATLRRIADRRRGEIRTVAVLPAWRRRGVARALVLAQAHGAQAQGLVVLAGLLRTPAAAALAASLGCRPESVSVDFLGPLLEDED